MCAACGASTTLVCASCQKARFCSAACAATAWAGHRAASAEFSVLADLPEVAALRALCAAVQDEPMGAAALALLE